MPTRDVGNAVKTVQSIKPQNQDGDGAVNGNGVDRVGFEGCVAAFNAGAHTGSPTAVAITCKLQECDTIDGTYTDITGASVTIDDQNQHKELNVDLQGCERYIRAQMAVAFTGGTSPTIDIAADIVLGNPKTLPQ